MNKRVVIIFIFLFSLLLYGKKREIFLIESYHKEYIWDIRYKEGLRSILKSDYEIKSFYMDTKRLPSSKFQKMSDSSWNMYKSLKPDLVVLGDDNALKYLWERFSNEDIPVVFLGINSNPRTYFKKIPKNFTGVLERPLLRKSIGYLIRIDKDLDKVLILFDSSVTSKAMISEVFKGKKSFNVGRVKVDLKIADSWKSWKKYTLNLGTDNYDALIMGSFYAVKDDGKYIHPEKIVKWTSENTPIPPYTFWDFAIGKEKAIGGLVDNGTSQGVEAGIIVKKILEEGMKPSKIAFKSIEEGRFVFSRVQLKKYKIKLPFYIRSRAKFID